MIIRNATQSDSGYIADYIMEAMEDIVYEFIGKNDQKLAKDFLLHFAKRENNQYSYQNCVVAQEGDEIIGAINVYDGAMLGELRAPIAQYIKTQHHKEFNPEDETQSGEYYIDSFGVKSDLQGKGIGTKLLQHVIDEYVNKNHQTLGLLVDEDKPLAKRLYLKLGFKPVGKKILAGKKMDHLQISGISSSD